MKTYEEVILAIAKRNCNITHDSNGELIPPFWHLLDVSYIYGKPISEIEKDAYKEMMKIRKKAFGIKES